MTPDNGGTTPTDFSIKIVSDGTPAGTHVYTPDGQELKLISNIDWHIGVGEVATARVEFCNVAVEMVAPDNNVLAKPVAAETRAPICDAQTTIKDQARSSWNP